MHKNPSSDKQPVVEPESQLDLNDPELMQAMESIVQNSKQKKAVPRPPVVDQKQFEAEEQARLQQELRAQWAKMDEFEGRLARLDRWEDRALVLQEMTDVFFQTEDARLRWSIMKNFENELENLSAKEMDFSNTTQANTHVVFLLRRYWEFASYTESGNLGESRLEKLKELRISNEMREFLEGYIHLGGDY